MTTAALVTMQDMRTELNSSGAKTMDDADMRWLAGVASTGAWSLSSAASKAGIKLVDNDLNTGNSAAGGPYTFAGVTFGDHFTGRKIIIAYNVWATVSGQNQFDTDYLQIKVDGVAASGSGNSGQWETGGSGLACWNGIAHWPTDSITATSGTVTVDWPGTHTANGCAILTMAVANMPTTIDTATVNGNAVFLTSVSESVTAVANGLIIQSVIRGATNAIVWTGGPTELYQGTVDTSFRLGLSFLNRQTAGTKAIGWTSGGLVPNDTVTVSRGT